MISSGPRVVGKSDVLHLRAWPPECPRPPLAFSFSLHPDELDEENPAEDLKGGYGGATRWEDPGSWNHCAECCPHHSFIMRQEAP